MIVGLQPISLILWKVLLVAVYTIVGGQVEAESTESSPIVEYINNVSAGALTPPSPTWVGTPGQYLPGVSTARLDPAKYIPGSPNQQPWSSIIFIPVGNVPQTIKVTINYDSHPPVEFIMNKGWTGPTEVKNLPDNKVVSIQATVIS